jgi:hypothetical protein
MNNYQELINKIRIINRSKKRKVFYFGNTSKKEVPKFYLTNIQENRKFIYFGAIIFNNSSATKIAKLVDGKVDFILVDIEKKVISALKNKNEIINIERCVKDEIKKTKLFTYKGNDLTVQAGETLINYIFVNDKRGVGGKKILILGSGNVGFKLALKLVESGADDYLYRRNKKILKKMVFAINSVIPKATVAKARMVDKLGDDLKQFDVILGTTNGKSIININQVNTFKKDITVIDIGKGIFKKKALIEAINKKINIYRLDVTPAYDGYLENIFSTGKINDLSVQKSRIYKKLKLVKKGILSSENSIIVDNVKSPKRIYGISDGYGSFKKFNKKEIIKIKKKLIKF